jgi:hypothetical protein
MVLIPGYRVCRHGRPRYGETRERIVSNTSTFVLFCQGDLAEFSFRVESDYLHICWMIGGLTPRIEEQEKGILPTLRNCFDKWNPVVQKVLHFQIIQRGVDTWIPSFDGMVGG